MLVTVDAIGIHRESSRNGRSTSAALLQPPIDRHPMPHSVVERRFPAPEATLR
jgi:hypothetical protein